MTPHPLTDRPWNGPCAITGKTLAWFEQMLASVKAGPAAKRAAVAICRSYGIIGEADPGYIANVIQSEFEGRKGGNS